MRIRVFIALAMAAVFFAGYGFVAGGARQPEQGIAVTPEDDPRLPPPRLPLPTTALAAEYPEGDSDRASSQFREISTDRLLDLAAHSASAWTRTDALEELTARRSNDALPVFLDRLSDPDSDVRRLAADGLAETGNQAALSALERALSLEAAQRTRLAMAQAIAELRQDPESTSEE